MISLLHDNTNRHVAVMEKQLPKESFGFTLGLDLSLRCQSLLIKECKIIT